MIKYQMEPFFLRKEPVFPLPALADKNGLLAVGGDLSENRLLRAYSEGIFPWYGEGDPILWWSPDPRMVLFPEDLHISRTMQKILRKNSFVFSMDSHFEHVIQKCSESRMVEKQTWITGEMKSAYTELFYQGYAHSAEVTLDGVLVGGLYGVSLGKCFFGESMFHTVPNASKYCFIVFVQKLMTQGFGIIDCQIKSSHLATFGAREISRELFLKMLKSSIQFPTIRGEWDF